MRHMKFATAKAGEVIDALDLAIAERDVAEAGKLPPFERRWHFPATRKRVVLIVDDEPDLADVLGDRLSGMDKRWQAELTISGALSIIAQGGVSRVLLDWRWPGSSPQLVVELCRQMAVPLAILTGMPKQVPSGLNLRVFVKPRDYSQAVGWLAEGSDG